jgi:NAD(P)-dependent dehydrogenase (short-subunit alcohol dehydrogenase family)
VTVPAAASSRPLIVTGGSRGIGAATARLAAARGYAVCLGYRTNRAAAAEVVRGIRDGGGTAVAVACDVAVETDVLRLFETCDRELGALAGLVNNAGVVAAKARVEAMSAGRLQRMFATNVIGSILCAREAVRRLSTRHGGRGGAIVNVSSAASRLGSADEYVDYAASKGAIDSFTLGLAREVAMDGIRVNAVRPGIVETEIHASGGQPDRIARVSPLVPVKRAGRVEEIAHAILWLLSDEASYTTGALLDVSGGR